MDKLAYKELLGSVIKTLAEHFGESSEFVLHDLTQGYESTIFAIENGNVTGRKVGDCGSNLGLEVLRGTVTEDRKINYITKTKNGRTLRSSTLYLRDENGEINASLCINTDITDFLSMKDTVNSIINIDDENSVNELFVNDVSELLEFFMGECQKEIGKAAADMNREEKIRAIEYLDKKGVFLINKSGIKVCELFNISKFTLYNYLEMIRNKQESVNHIEFHREEKETK